MVQTYPTKYPQTLIIFDTAASPSFDPIPIVFACASSRSPSCSTVPPHPTRPVKNCVKTKTVSGRLDKSSRGPTAQAQENHQNLFVKKIKKISKKYTYPYSKPYSYLPMHADKIPLS